MKVVQWVERQKITHVYLFLCRFITIIYCKPLMVGKPVIILIRVGIDKLKNVFLEKVDISNHIN